MSVQGVAATTMSGGAARVTSHWAPPHNTRLDSGALSYFRIKKSTDRTDYSYLRLFLLDQIVKMKFEWWNDLVDFVNRKELERYIMQTAAIQFYV